MQSSLILKQRRQIHLNSQIFFIISVTVLKMDKQSDFHLSLFSRDFTGVTKLIKKILFKGFSFFMRVVYFKFFSFFARRNKNGKNNKKLKSICANHQSERTKYFTCSEK